jgi:Polyketide cyclase / dehydrase and lipid transport
MTVAVEVERYVAAPLEVTFATIVPIELATVFPGFGPLPAVAATREQSSAWDRVGATRIVELSDGTAVREELTAYEAPRFFAYRVGPFGGFAGLVIGHADGTWWFTDGGPRGTHVRWRYEFTLRGSRPVALLARVVIERLWRAYAERVLAMCAVAVETG